MLNRFASYRSVPSFAMSSWLDLCNPRPLARSESDVLALP